VPEWVYAQTGFFVEASANTGLAAEQAFKIIKTNFEDHIKKACNPPLQFFHGGWMKSCF
jgi:hypothetical protein